MNKDVLLEIGTEEIPARCVNSAAEQLKEITAAGFAAHRLKYRRLSVYSTCRRLIIYAEKVSEIQAPQETEIVGPPAAIAFAKGVPTPAAVGFAQKYGLAVKDIYKKNGRICLLKKESCRKTNQVLPELFPGIISSLSFPKSMVWESTGFRFVRPIRWVLALMGGNIIKFSIAGVKSGAYTYLRYGKRIKITEPAAFVDTLRNNSIIAESNIRLKMLNQSLAAAVKGIGVITAGNELLELVNNLVEFPSAMLCRFDEKYLSVPKELIAFTLKKQFNFSVKDSAGNLLPYFVGVKDGISTTIKPITAGYEKVIEARLADAEFYLKTDTKTKLQDKVPRLKDIVFHEKLGSVYDKMVRITELTRSLAAGLGGSVMPDKSILERICILCKADLSTGTVAEFPELQGVFGRICALRDKEPQAVALGIEQHWQPLNYDGVLPEQPEAALVAIADKIDTLTGNFSIGLLPTGSADPYGLRRLSFGIVRIAVEKEIGFSLSDIIGQSISLQRCAVPNPTDVIAKAKDFIKQRFITHLKGNGISQDVIDSALASDFDDILDAYRRVVALNGLRSLPDFESIAVAFKRIGNILKQSDKSGSANFLAAPAEPEESIFKMAAEKKLYDSYRCVNYSFQDCLKNKEYDRILKLFISMRDPVDSFFEEVLIMDKDEAVKVNRLKLLSGIYFMFRQIADFSRIITEK